MQIDNISFWGIFLIITGIALLVREIFNIEFPVFKVMAGLFFVLLGLRIMLGNSLIWPIKTIDNEVFFRTLNVDSPVDMHSEYQLVFSKTIFDLSQMDLPENRIDLKINNIFSGNTVYLPSGIPVNIRVDAVFAGVKMPGRNTPVFGRGSYSSENFDADLPHLNINVNIVFGNVVFMFI